MKTFKVEKIKYKDGIGGAIWSTIGEKVCDGYEICKEETCDCTTGLCFDFSDNEIDSIIDALQHWKNMEAKEYVEEETDIDFDEKETFFTKLKDFLTSISITFKPFEWEFGAKFKGRFNIFYSIVSKNSRGIKVGPIQIVLPSFDVFKNK